MSAPGPVQREAEALVCRAVEAAQIEGRPYADARALHSLLLAAHTIAEHRVGDDLYTDLACLLDAAAEYAEALSRDRGAPDDLDPFHDARAALADALSNMTDLEDAATERAQDILDQCADFADHLARDERA